MGNNTLSNSLRNALSYENEYNKALSAYRNAVVQVNLRKDALNITVADRIKTMIPEAVITAIFLVGTRKLNRTCNRRSSYIGYLW